MSIFNIISSSAISSHIFVSVYCKDRTMTALREFLENSHTELKFPRLSIYCCPGARKPNFIIEN